MSDIKSAGYTASSLADIADAFDMYASDQLAMNPPHRNYGTKKEQNERRVRAQTWTDAANMLRQTTIVSEPDK